MAILEDEVWVEILGKAIKYYKNLGYHIPFYKNKEGKEIIKKGTKILVKVNDLPDGSNAKVTKICEEINCGAHVKTIYMSVVRSRKENRKDRCKKCINKEKLDLINAERIKTHCVSITHPELAILFWDKEDTNNYFHQSNSKVDFKCPTCGDKLHQKRVQDVFKYGLSCVKCSDGYSYSEKFMYSLLTQLNIVFETQKSFEWGEGKRYDFYLTEYNAIIETHGSQHYEGDNFRGLKEEQENDFYKMQLATKNGIKKEKYIEVDCRRSTLEFTEKSIMKNGYINTLLDISKVDFSICHQQALKPMAEIISALFEKGNKIIDISRQLKMHRSTVRGYLKQGGSIGLNDYSSNKGKEVVQLTLSGEYVAEFSTIREASELTNTNNSCIASCCVKTRKTANGFKWMHKKDYTKLTKVT